MAEIKEPEAVMLVQGRLEGRGQGQGQGGAEQPPKKVAETYGETARAQPEDDIITILGIPIDKITSATHAALSGLVAENNYLRNALSRHERAARKGTQSKDAQPEQNALLVYNDFVEKLAALLMRSPGEGASWMLILIHLKTYEALRRNSGLLAANGALDDVGHRFTQIRIGHEVAEASAPADTSILASPSEAPVSLAEQNTGIVHLSLAGYAGGSSIAGLAAVQNGADTTAIARSVRDHICESGFHVGGVDMALEIQVAAAACGLGESPLLALGRADQLLRAS